MCGFAILVHADTDTRFETLVGTAEILLQLCNDIEQQEEVDSVEVVRKVCTSFKKEFTQVIWESMNQEQEKKSVGFAKKLLRKMMEVQLEDSSLFLTGLKEVLEGNEKVQKDLFEMLKEMLRDEVDVPDVDDDNEEGEEGDGEEDGDTGGDAPSEAEKKDIEWRIQISTSRKVHYAGVAIDVD